LIPDPPAALPLFVTPLAVTAALFLGALLLAETSVRLLRVPRIAALVVAGALLGWLRGRVHAASLMPVPRVLLEALAIVLLFEVGQRVPLGWIRRNPWMLAASLCDTAVAFLVIFAVLVLGFERSTLESMYVGAICMAASPIVVLSVTKDLGARGQVAERALLYSALSSVYAALALQLLEAGSLAAAHAQVASALQPLLQLGGAFLLAALAAAVLRLYALLTGARGAVLTIGILCACVLLYGAALALGLSPILAALFFGLVVRATDRSHQLLSHQSSETGAVVTIGYFILLGASFTGFADWHVVAIATAVMVVRLAAKVGVHALLATPSALEPLKGAYVGLALAPLSSMAVLFAAGLARTPGLQEAAQICAAVVLGLAVVGPVLTEVALRVAREPTRRGT
jgi:Kef-type K+ transport system membrane component KefB